MEKDYAKMTKKQLIELLIDSDALTLHDRLITALRKNNIRFGTHQYIDTDSSYNEFIYLRTYTEDRKVRYSTELSFCNDELTDVMLYAAKKINKYDTDDEPRIASNKTLTLKNKPHE